MASSGRFDLSSSSSGRPVYIPGKRGSNTAASMDRSSSFRENKENPVLSSSLLSMSRSTINVSQGDVTNFFQCLRFDLKSMASEYKGNRHGDFRQLANAALCAPDDLPFGSLKGKLPSSSLEDLKRLKVGLRESTIKARERVKIFSEVLSVINKCFPSTPSRKRSRPDAFSGDRSNVLFADHTAIGKMGFPSSQSHALANAFDYEQQKVEERGKNNVSHKRTRTSLVDQRADVRPNTPARSTGSVDRDREVIRLPNDNVLQGEGQTLPSVVDGWEKAKMKKKRTGVKADAALSMTSGTAKPINGSREPRQGMYQRNLADARSRLHDSHLFRQGAVNGGIRAGKADGPSLHSSMGMRSSIPRPEQEHMSLLNDKRDQTTNLEQERTNVRALNKANVREDFTSVTSSSTTKLHASARAPRSGSGVIPKLCHFQRSIVSNGLEPSHGTNKNPGAIGSTSRKRTQSTRSSSPPVAQWADRRPQKISRTARRTNLVPVVSISDEIPALGNSDVTISEKGRGTARRFPTKPPKRFKSEVDHLQSSTLSESEESGAAEIRSRDNSSKSEKGEEKVGPDVQKMSTLVHLTRKNNFMSEDGLAPIVFRQGRTGRGSASARSVVPVEKLANVGTTKQLRPDRVDFDKPESRSGRLPTRKLSGRRAYIRHSHSAITVTADFLDDGNQELLAAVNAVISPGALSSPFWRLVDPLFGFVSDADMTYLKQEGCIQSSVNITNSIDGCDKHSEGSMLVKPPKTRIESCSEWSGHLTSGSSPGGISLCQRLLAALISEDNNEYDVHGSAFEPETDVESNGINCRSSQNFEIGGSFSGSYRMAYTLRSWNELVQSEPDNHVMSMADSTFGMGFDHCYSGLQLDPAMMPGISCSQYQYGNMSMDERLLMEIHSLGLYPARVPDLIHPGDEEVSKDITRLEEKHYQQVSKKKNLLDKLLKSTEEARELHEKEFEQLSLDKLIGIAYQKYMSCWGSNEPGGKGANVKMAKQAALNSVKRTLERCHKFEATGKSCFTEPLFREMFLSGLSHINNVELDAVVDGEFGKMYGTSMKIFPGIQLSPLLDNHDIYPSEQATTSKDDAWSRKGKKRELYLDDVAGTSSGMPPAVGRAIINSAKGKRSGRDREGKGYAPRNGAAPKIGRPGKGERKTKAKLKQKATQLPAPVGKFSGQQRTPFSSIPKSMEMKGSTAKEKDQSILLENSEEPLDLSHLQLPEMDDFGVGNDFGGQGQDIGSWLNIDEDGLQDADFMGLEIPMDDLTDLNMMV